MNIITSIVNLPQTLYEYISKTINSLMNPAENVLQLPEYKLEDTVEYKRIISDSLERIENLKTIQKSVNSEIVNDVIDYTVAFHDIVVNKKLKIQKLEQFHMYYTDNFIQLMEDLIKNKEKENINIQIENNKLIEELELKRNKIGKIQKRISKIDNGKKNIKEYDKAVSNYILGNFDVYFVKKTLNIKTENKPQIVKKK